MKQLSGKRQWDVGMAMKDMVEAGEIAFPVQVKKEMSEIAHPDFPGVWAEGVFPSLQHPKEPAAAYVQRVMASPASAVVDPDKTKEDGDPYLIALALQLIDEGYDVCVVTDDQRTTAIRMSVSDACGLLSVTWCGFGDFLSHVEGR